MPCLVEPSFARVLSAGAYHGLACALGLCIYNRHSTAQIAAPDRNTGSYLDRRFSPFCVWMSRRVPLSVSAAVKVKLWCCSGVT